MAVLPHSMTPLYPRLARLPRGGSIAAAVAVALTLLVVNLAGGQAALIALTSLNQTGLDLRRAPRPQTQALAQWLETSEAEIVFLSNRTYHQPASAMLNAATRYVQLGEPYPAGFYDFRDAHPQYLVIGPFARYANLCAPGLATGCCERLAGVGEYELCQVLPQAGPR